MKINLEIHWNWRKLKPSFTECEDATRESETWIGWEIQLPFMTLEFERLVN